MVEISIKGQYSVSYDRNIIVLLGTAKSAYAAMLGKETKNGGLALKMERLNQINLSDFELYLLIILIFKN